MPEYAGQYAFPRLSQYWLVPWYVHDFPQFRQQFIRLRNMLQPKPVAVKIIIYPQIRNYAPNMIQKRK